MMSVELPPNERPKAVRTNENSRNIMSGSMIGGIVLVTLGVIFLLQTTGLLGRLPFEFNWWALFILIPAVGAFDSAIPLYRNADNQITGTALGSLLVGLVLTFVTTSFLFNLNWSFFEPILPVERHV